MTPMAATMKRNISLPLLRDLSTLSRESHHFITLTSRSFFCRMREKSLVDSCHQRTSRCHWSRILGRWLSGNPDRTPSKYKYVDDSTISARLSMKPADKDNSVAVTTKVKQALQTQNLFRRIVSNAESIGMKINEAKNVANHLRRDFF